MYRSDTPNRTLDDGKYLAKPIKSGTEETHGTNADASKDCYQLACRVRYLPTRTQANGAIWFSIAKWLYVFRGAYRERLCLNTFASVTFIT